MNALLSFGYTLLFHNVYGLLSARGLNGHVGLLHAERAGHPALASDLMEEFRAPIVDAAVLNLLFNKRLDTADFSNSAETGACIIAQRGIKLLIRTFEQKMKAAVMHTATGNKLDYRRCIDSQVRQLIECFRDPARAYHPFLIR